MAKIIFFTHETPDGISKMEYYNQDVLALRRLGHDVSICTRAIDISPKFDLIYIWWWTHALYPVLLSKVFGKKSVITGVFNFRHPAYSQSRDYFARPLWQKFLIRSALISADLNLFVSKSEYIECAEYFRISAKAYSPCCVGVDYGKVIPVKRTLRMLNISWSGAGNLRRKGIFDILDAAEILVSRGFAPQITLAGKTGDGFRGLVEGVRQRRLEKYVELAGELSLEEKLSVLANSEIYLQPSYYEGFGLAIAEAMASGVCVITCDVGEVRDVVGDEAIYVSPGKPSELADAIVRVSTDADLRARLQESGRERIMRLFSFDSKVENIRSALAKVGIV